MHTSIATVCLAGTLAEKLRAAADAGFDGVEIFEQDLTVSPHSPEQIRDKAKELGLSIDLFQPFRDLLSVTEDEFQDNLRRLEAKFRLMNRLGVSVILACSNVGTASVDDDEVRVDQLRRAGDLAQRYGCKIAYEALAWGKHVNRYEHAHRIVESVDHPNVGTCLDSFHILSLGDSPDAIASMNPEKIFFLQLADAPKLEMGVLSWSRHHRVFPGEGDLELVEFMSRVIESGYEGPVSLEIFNDSFREADTLRTAKDGLRALKWLADKALEKCSSGESAMSYYPKLKPLSKPKGYDYIELKTRCLGDTVKLLHQLGFKLGGFHKTREGVQLWVQGNIRLVVVEQDDARAPLALKGFGVFVDDTGSAFDRAKELNSVEVPREQKPGEAVLRGVFTPDNTELFFSHHVSNEEGALWANEFGLLPSDIDETELISGIDHLALSQPQHTVAEARLFFSSVLGLRPLEPESVVSPAGLVWHQSMKGENLMLTVSVAPSSSEQGDFLNKKFPQHVTFEAGDIIAVAQRAQTRGMKMLTIPTNYYEDLIARFGLAESEVEILSNHNILYDRDDSGEYLHFFTESMGEMFFEVCERRGEYKGHGWANDPTRLAAQYRELRDSVRGIPQ